METKIFTGKTKEVYSFSDDMLLLEFRDTVLGQDGVPDPGGNEVVDFEAGKGCSSMRLSEILFKLLSANGINNHFIKTVPEKNAILVNKANVFGKGLEFICRLKAYGTYFERYSEYVDELDDLNYFVEITIKDDLKRDPFISDESIVRLGLMNIDELKCAKRITADTAKVINDALGQKGLSLIDLKVEFGNSSDGLVLIDAMNSDNMRVMDREQNLVLYTELLEKLSGTE